jgi:hypothetical protein
MHPADEPRQVLNKFTIHLHAVGQFQFAFEGARQVGQGFSPDCRKAPRLNAGL